MVMIKDDDLPLNRWQLARVVETYASNHDHMRKVTLILSDPALSKLGCPTHPTTYLERPIQKLVLLVEGEDQSFPDKEP